MVSNMKNTPAFYLTTAGEYVPLTYPRTCIACGRLCDAIRDDYMFVKFPPPLTGSIVGISNQKDIAHLLLASKWRNLTLFPINQWPMPVYVMTVIDENILTKHSFDPDQVKIIAWGTLHQTFKEANEIAGKFQ
jgi:hypothetical protein